MKFDLIKIGFLSRVHGFKGEIKAVLEVDVIENKIPEFIFLHIEGKPVPFYVEKCQIQEDQLLIKFEDINDEASAGKFKNASMFCEAKLFETYFAKIESLEDLIGFEVSDNTKGNIGIVIGIIENSIQPTLVIELNEKEILIPYSEDIILEINDNDKKVNIDAPEGLIDMYLA
ncbi:MAG: ribosome maturation factor RimM [Chitinophagales bacterium]